jgi:peptide/nickel transport system substrate-binding protein
MPEHYCGEPADMFNWDYNQTPLGTGPYKLVEWVQGSHVVLERNDLYREEGKPYIDQMIFQFVPSADTALVMLQSGEADIIYGATVDQIPALRLRDNIVIDAKPSRWVEVMWLNVSEPGDGQGDAEPPHPILGDIRVRHALSHAINRQRIVDNLIYGLSQPGTSIITTGWARNNDLEPWLYDTAEAERLLEEAGWIDEDGDGIREAHDAMYVKDGTRLSLRYQAATGDQLREQVQQLVVEDAAVVGIELRIDNAATTVVMGSWEAGGTRKTGDFDIVEYATGVRIDPQNLMEGFFHSMNIPRAENNGAGYNYSRISDPELDAILEAAGSTFDQEERAEYFRQAQDIILQSGIHIYLYDDLDVQVYNSKIQGWRHNIFLKQGWNAQDWWIKE